MTVVKYFHTVYLKTGSDYKVMRKTEILAIIFCNVKLINRVRQAKPRQLAAECACSRFNRGQTREICKS